MSINNDFQIAFFDKLNLNYTKRASLVDQLCEILNVSKDAVYRRMRGDTLITPDEFVLLSKKFSISLDEMIYKNENLVLFQFNAFSKKIYQIEDYLDNLLVELQELRRLPNLHFYYPSCEIPLFYYCCCPELFLFKLYVWGRSVWNIEYLEKSKFSLDLFTTHVQEKIEKILSEYLLVNSTELWSLNIFDNTLNQIEYHAESGYFKNNDDAIRLCREVKIVAEHLQKMASSGQKSHPNLLKNQNGGTFTLYQNEMIYTNNMVIVESDGYKAVHSSFCNPNFISSQDEKLFDYSYVWFNAIIKKSVPISKTDEKNRHKFFHSIHKKIDSALVRIS